MTTLLQWQKLRFPLLPPLSYWDYKCLIYVVLRIQPRASCIVGKSSSEWPTSVGLSRFCSVSIRICLAEVNNVHLNIYIYPNCLSEIQSWQFEWNILQIACHSFMTLYMEFCSCLWLDLVVFASIHLTRLFVVGKYQPHLSFHFPHWHL
jgi:hypothetical protein